MAPLESSTRTRLLLSSAQFVLLFALTIFLLLILVPSWVTGSKSSNPGLVPQVTFLSQQTGRAGAYLAD